MSAKIRILVADDHPVVREGLRAILGTKPDLEIVAEAVDGVEVVQLAQQEHPDVILMDLMMPKQNGIEAIRQIRAMNPLANILVLTSFIDDEQVFSAIKAGALGYVLKDSSSQDLIEAIRCVYRGESSLHPAVARKLILRFDNSLVPEEKNNELTGRELEVLKLVAQGLTNQEIARKLFVGEGTVRFHVSNILSKLHLENRTQAVLFALREGLITLNE